MKVTISLLAIFIISNLTLAQWFQQVSGTTEQLTDVDFIDENVGTAVGTNGTILRTTDGGTTWTPQTSGTTAGLLGVSFTDANTGTVVGYNNTILRTTNGGITWTPQVSGSNGWLNDVSFIDSDHGTIIGFEGTILRTTNGGQTWIDQTIGPEYTYFEAVSFCDVNNGMICGNLGILKTSDGGTTWNEIGYLYYPYYDVDYIDENHAFALGYHAVIHKTTNGGEDWTEQFIEPPPYNSGIIYYGVSFSDINNGTVVGEFRTIYKTTDGGANWKTQSGLPGYFSELRMYNIAITTNNNIYGCGDYCSVTRTTNNGATWISKKYSHSQWTPGDITFIDNNIGTAVNSCGIFRTTDGGMTWVEQSSQYGGRKVSFIDKYNGITVGWNGEIFSTTNGGIDWISRTSGTENLLEGIQYLEDNTAVAVGMYGTILKTTNGGIDWIPQTSGTTLHLEAVYFTDTNNGVVVGQDETGMFGVMLRTTNGGNTWNIQTNVSELAFTDVTFFDEYNGMALGIGPMVGGKILRTSDGGITWYEQSVEPPLYRMSFYDMNNGVARSSNDVYKTTDGGINWTPLYIDCTFQAVSFTNANTGTVVGDGGTILRTTNGGSSPFFSISSPNGGENWQVGSEQEITWSWNDVTDVKLEYTTNNGIDWITIETSTPCDGSYDWTIPDTPSDECKVRISDVINPSTVDESDEVFSIGHPSILLTSPNGGENWQIGTENTIEWISNFIDNVKIEYSTNNGTDWIIVESATISDGTYTWTVPDTKSLQCKVKITDILNPLITYESDNVFKITYIPVIVIPGIMGSALFNDTNDDNHLFRNPNDYQNDEFIWVDDKQLHNFLDNDEFLEVLELLDDGFTPASTEYKIKVAPLKNDLLTTVGHIKNILPTNKYAGLLNDLEGNGYILDDFDFDHTEGEDLYFFTYDWRKSSARNDTLLNDFIDSVLYNWNSAEQANLVCHSMGGLVAKKYIQVFGKTKIKKLIFIATPHLGAPKILYVMLSGDLDFGMFTDLFFYNDRIRQMSRNMPSTYELMPSQNYYNLNLDNGVSNNADRYAYCFNSPEFGNSSYSEVLQFFSSIILPGGFTYNFNLNINADSFRDDISNVDLEGIEVYNLVGYDKPTIGLVEYKDRRFFPINKDRNLSGDGTVPLKSAEIVNLQKMIADWYVLDVEHSDLPSSVVGTFLIKNLLQIPANFPLPDPPLYQRVPPDNYAANNIIQLLVGSPVELHAYDLLGNHTGPTSDSTWEESIPGSEYFPGDLRDPHSTKSIIIPNETEFRVEIISQDTLASFDFIYDEIINGISEIELVYDSVITQENTIASMEIFDTTNVYVLEIDYDGNGMADTTILPSITNYCIEYPVQADWNLISLPYLMEQYLKVNLFPSAISNAYWFDGGYVAKDTLEVRRGYWLKFPSSFSIISCGQLVEDTIHIKSGWNMIGGFNDDIPVSNISTEPPGILPGSFWGYNGSYNLADTLKMGKGYWIKSDAEGIINLNQSLNKSSENVSTIHPNWARINIRDNNEREIKLYFAENVNLDHYELPPLPPAGAFDIRFDSQLIVEDLSKGDKIINISGAAYPITMKVSGREIQIKDVINGSLLNQCISDGEEVVIDNNQIDKILIHGENSIEAPITYNLDYNYPNPFNPNTVIKFSIPEEIQVNLTVFNILGEKVKELKNETMKPGFYEVEFDASVLASGVYLYSIKAGSFIETRKMVLLK